MHVLCPHCRNPIEVVKLSAREEITCPSCGSSFRLESGSTTGWERKAGQKLGRFTLLDVVGQGAFGTVYKARDPELDRVVALKVPRAGNLAGPHELDRFLREARSAAQLRHPSIVSVHEVAQSDGVTFLVSDFAQGVTLSDLLSARQPTFREAADLIAAVAEALHHAHGQGVVHRDVKASNIMIDDGKPCVMDFGLAKRDAGEITMTVEGQILGTPAYMPPEQARGEGHRVDARGDVYSLGVVLYQVLTGELPFRGTTRMLLHQVLHDEPKSPRTLNDRIPRDLETVTLKAMAKEPGRRYQTAKEMADDLRRWLGGDPILARPAGRLERGLRWARRRPAAAGLLGMSAVAMLALVGVIVGVVYNAELKTAYQQEAEARGEAEGAREAEAEERKKAERALRVAEDTKRGEEVQRQRAEAALATADRIGHKHSLFLAQLALTEHDFARAEERLAECKPGLRDWLWYHLEARCHEELYRLQGQAVWFSRDGKRLALVNRRRLSMHDAFTGEEHYALPAPVAESELDLPQLPNVIVPAVDPRETRLAVTGQDGYVRVYELATGKERLLLRGAKRMGRPTFSPNGARIAVAPAAFPNGDGQVRVFDADSGKEVVACPGALALFDNDGTRIAVQSAARRNEKGVLRVFAARTGQEVFLCKDVSFAEFSPDGSYLALQSMQGLKWAVRLVSAKDGKELGALSRPMPSSVLGLGVGFSPDSTRFAFSTSAGASGKAGTLIRVYDLRTLREITTLEGSSFDFSPSGGQLAVSSADLFGNEGYLRLYDFQTQKVVFAVRTSSPAISFSPDGSRVLSSPMNKAVSAHVYDTRTGEELLTLGGKQSFVASEFSPDGSRVGFVSAGRTTHVYDARAGTEILALPGTMVPGLFANKLAHPKLFSPDGSRIFVSRGGKSLSAFDARLPAGSFPENKPGRPNTRPGPLAQMLQFNRSSSPSFSPDGERVVHVFSGPSGPPLLRVFDSRTGQELFDFPGAWSADFSPDGKQLAVSLPWDSGILVCSARDGRELYRRRGAGRPAFSPDGTRIAFPAPFGEGANSLQVCEASTGKELLTLVGDGWLGEPAFSPDGKRIAVAPCEDGRVRVFDSQTGKLVHALPNTPSVPPNSKRRRARAFPTIGAPDSRPVFSSDGARIVVPPPPNEQLPLRVYDSRSGKETFTASIKRPPFSQSLIARSPDGTKIAFLPQEESEEPIGVGGFVSIVPNVVKLYDLHSDEQIISLKGLGTPEFSPDGSLIVLPGSGVFDARTGRQVFSLQAGGTSSTASPAFSPDSAILACGLTSPVDAKVQLYDARSGQELLSFRDGRPRFSPDGSLLAIVTADGVLRLHPAPRNLESWARQRRNALAEGQSSWHRRQAIDSDQHRNWFAMAFHREWLASADPRSGAHPYHRGRALEELGRHGEAEAAFRTALERKADLVAEEEAEANARLGRWGDAATLYAKVVEGPRFVLPQWEAHAILRLHQGDKPGYRKACARIVDWVTHQHGFHADMQRRFEDFAPVGTFPRQGIPADVLGGVERAGWICSIAPDALRDLLPALNLTSAALKASPDNWVSQRTHGAILYRMGRYEECKAILEAALAKTNQPAAPSPLYFLALAHHRLGMAAEARRLLDRSRDAHDKLPQAHWSARLSLRILRHEAEALIRPTAKDAKP